MKEIYCQSCGMPLQNEEALGTNKDGTKNEEYCCYCFKNGAFIKNYTLDEMITHCLRYLDEFNKELDVHFTKEEAIANMKSYFPTLKRWSNS